MSVSSSLMPTSASTPELIRRVDIAAKPDPAIVSHHVKPAALLEIARTLYGRAPQAELISIRGFDFDFGDELTRTADSVKAVAQSCGRIWRAAEPPRPGSCRCVGEPSGWPPDHVHCFAFCAVLW